MAFNPALDYFIVIAKHNNITKAAEELYISQQTLSTYLKKLEEYYQIQLFERYPKLHLTEAGQIVYDIATEITNSYDRINQELDRIKNIKHTLRLGICKAKIDNLLGYYPLPDMKFEHSDVVIEMIENTSTELEKELKNGSIDFYIGNEDVASEQLESYPIRTYPYYIFISPKMFREYVMKPFSVTPEECLKNGVDLKIFKGVPFIASQFGHLRSYVAEYENRCNFKFNIVLENANPNLRIQMTKYDVGFTISEESCERYDALYSFRIREPQNGLNLGLIRRKTPYPQYMEEFWENTLNNIRKKLNKQI